MNMIEKLNLPAAPSGTQFLTPERIFVTAAIILLANVSVYVGSLLTSENLVVRIGDGPPFGGDFVVFWVAAKSMFAGMAQEIYDLTFFETQLRTLGPPVEEYRLTWQYPPTYYFFVAPLAGLPFLPAYFLWAFGFAAFYAVVIQRLFDLPKWGLALAMATPVGMVALATGQNAFFTAALLALSVCLADRRPVLAGIAAGLLTIKPQLGVLIPVAFLAAGCWRAFFTAAFVALSLVAASLLAFGVEAWAAFFESILRVSGGMKGGVYPLGKMPTVFSALHQSGLPRDPAMAIQICVALATMAATGFIWRQVKNWDLRAAFLCCATYLCTPYAFYYEFTILILPALVVARRGFRHGWLKGEEIGLALVFFAPQIIMSLPMKASSQFGFVCVMILLTMVTRRILHHSAISLPSWLDDRMPSLNRRMHE